MGFPLLFSHSKALSTAQDARFMSNSKRRKLNSKSACLFAHEFIHRKYIMPVAKNPAAGNMFFANLTIITSQSSVVSNRSVPEKYIFKKGMK